MLIVIILTVIALGILLCYSICHKRRTIRQGETSQRQSELTRRIVRNDRPRMSESESRALDSAMDEKDDRLKDTKYWE